MEMDNDKYQNVLRRGIQSINLIPRKYSSDDQEEEEWAQSGYR